MELSCAGVSFLIAPRIFIYRTFHVKFSPPLPSNSFRNIFRDTFFSSFLSTNEKPYNGFSFRAKGGSVTGRSADARGKDDEAGQSSCGYHQRPHWPVSSLVSDLIGQV